MSEPQTTNEAACGGSALTAELGDYNPLIPAFEAMRMDAERYRWLRGGQDIPPHSRRWPRWEVRNWDGRWWETLFAEKLDAAIDAAMQHDKVPNDQVQP